jgi:branched-chain amino acid transport system ATP-binding protein
VTLLAIRGLTAAYDGVAVLHDVDLALDDGSFTAVIGANTAGKSTLLRSISGLVPRVTGSIRFRDDELVKRPAHRIATLGIAHVPEGRHVFPAMSVEENLWLGAYARRREPDLAHALERVFVLFPKLAERRRQSAGTLSGGEQQMVAIGRALMGAPKLLLLDEPSHGLAPKIVREMHDALVAIHRSGVTVLLVEQNTKLALSVAQHALVLESGRVVLSGAAADLASDARVREAYLGL